MDFFTSIFARLVFVFFGVLWGGLTVANESVENLSANRFIVTLNEKSFSTTNRINSSGETVRDVAERLLSEVRVNQLAVDQVSGKSQSRQSGAISNSLDHVLSVL